VCLYARLCPRVCVSISMSMSVSEQNRKQCVGVEEGAVCVLVCVLARYVNMQCNTL